MARHLVGLQAQENLPPYLSLAARLTSFDPYDVTARARGPHAGAAPDHARHRAPARRRRRADAAAVDRAGARAGDQGQPEHRRGPRGGPGRVRRGALGAARRRSAAAEGDRRRAGRAVPRVPATLLGQLARSAAPLVQCPPRGTWKGSGGVVYQYVDRWLGRPLVEPDVEGIVRRYLRRSARPLPPTSPPGRPSPGSAPVLKAMDDLVAHEDEQGKLLYDVPGAESPTRTPPRRCGCSASTTTSGSPTPAATG